MRVYGVRKTVRNIVKVAKRRQEGGPRNAVIKEELSFKRKKHSFDVSRSACVLDIHLDLAATLSYISISESLSTSTLDKSYSHPV